VAHAGLNRRQFLIRGGGATLGVGLFGAREAEAEAAGEPRIRNFRKLGRTDLMISDIGFGSSRSTDPDLVRHAFERGVNYFDTAESYKGGRSELAIGEALQGHRDQVILASKVSAEAHATRAELMRALEGSLRRLRTDRIEIYFNHAVNSADRLKNDEWAAFADRAKQQGKIRWTGMSGHGGRLIECLDYALDNDLVDVVLCAYNFGQDPAFYQRFTSQLDWIAVQPELPRVFAKAAAMGVGTVAMKTLRGARLNDMRPYERGSRSFAQAAFRWVLANPNVSGLVVSMTSREQIDEYLRASGKPAPGVVDLDLLERYLQSSVEGDCDHGCNVCESACPHGVAISEVLRTRMYAVDYGDVPYARENYARLAVDAGACATCADTPCLGRCPAGIDIPRLTLRTERLLQSRTAKT